MGLDLTGVMGGPWAAFLSLDQIADVMTALASLAVIAGIGIAWREYRGRRSEYECQLEDSKRQTEDSRVALLTGMSQYLNQVARVFIEYPGMRKYFHDGCRPGRRDRPRAQAIAVILANAMDHALIHLAQVGGEEREIWELYFDHVLKTSPVLIEYLDEHEDWYGPQLRNRFRIAQSR